VRIALYGLEFGNPSQSYGASPAIWDHTVLPATRHRWTHPTLTPAKQASTLFTYPGGMEGWVDLSVGSIPRRFACPQTVTHPGSNHLIATRPGVEPTTSRSQVQRPNRYTTKPHLTQQMSNHNCTHNTRQDKTIQSTTVTKQLHSNYKIAISEMWHVARKLPIM